MLAKDRAGDPQLEAERARSKASDIEGNSVGKGSSIGEPVAAVPEEDDEMLETDNNDELHPSLMTMEELCLFGPVAALIA